MCTHIETLNNQLPIHLTSNACNSFSRSAHNIICEPNEVRQTFQHVLPQLEISHYSHKGQPQGRTAHTYSTYHDKPNDEYVLRQVK